MSYRTVIDWNESETVEKKSRFIGRLYPVSSEEQVKEIIARVKKEHHQANHCCSAFRLHDQQKTERYSDDGEPGGTAGMPMLEVLRGQGLENILALSIRYFGGTKLGTGGLVRAYTESVQDVLAEAETVTIGSFAKITLEVAYDLSGKVDYHINSGAYLLDDTRYGEKVAYDLYVDAGEVVTETQVFVELTNGQCSISAQDPVDGYISKGRVII